MNRFGLRTFLLAAGLTAALTISAGAASLGTATVNASALRLRAGAGTGSAILSMAYQGESVEVLEDAGNGWYKVSYKGMTGYMSGEYLVLNAAAAPTQTAAAPAQTASTAPQSMQVNVGAGGVLNLRSGPSAQYTKLGTIPNGTVLTVEETANGWCKVTYSGQTGYVSGSYLVAATAVQTATTATGTAAVSYDGSFGSSVVALAKQYIGRPYSYGASGPNAFDCSGFTSFIYKQMGVSIPHGATGQYRSGTAVSRENLQPGDLVFIAEPGYTAGYPVSHVGIYVGNGKFIHAAYRTGITIDNLFTGYYSSYYVGARRFV